LRTRPIRPDLEFLKISKKKIFEMKMKIAEAEESPPWDMNDLEAALSNLKNNKARDSEGFINEIFKSDVIGNDLKKSLLVMFNKMKEAKLISMFLNIATITTVPKKGSKIELKNERGIFLMRVKYK
jgi:hypothetical protein